jgi:hypothetical protein
MPPQCGCHRNSNQGSNKEGCCDIRGDTVEPITREQPARNESKTGTVSRRAAVCGKTPAVGEEWDDMSDGACGRRDNKRLIARRQNVGVRTVSARSDPSSGLPSGYSRERRLPEASALAGL